jgi:tetratricopeptide (TPR) repeat protein
MIHAALLVVALGAGESTASAKHLYEAGAQAYDDGRYLLAIDAFEESQKLQPRAVTAFALAQALRFQYFIDGSTQKLERAIEMYRAYLSLEPTGSRMEHAGQHLATLVPILERLKREGAAAAAPKPQPKTLLIVACRTKGCTARIDSGPPEPAPAPFQTTPGVHKIEVEAPQHVALSQDAVAVADTVVAIEVKLEPQPGHVEVKAPRGAEVSVDGRSAGVSPLAAPLELKPGRHVVAVSASGRRTFVRDVQLDIGQALLLDAAELELTTQRWFAYAATGAAAGLLIGAATLLAFAGAREDDAGVYDRKLGMMMALTTDEARDYRQLLVERDELVRAGLITGTVAVAAAVVALVLWLTDRPEAADRR